MVTRVAAIRMNSMMRTAPATTIGDEAGATGWARAPMVSAAAFLWSGEALLWRCFVLLSAEVAAALVFKSSMAYGLKKKLQETVRAHCAISAQPGAIAYDKRPANPGREAHRGREACMGGLLTR